MAVAKSLEDIIAEQAPIVCEQIETAVSFAESEEDLRIEFEKAIEVFRREADLPELKGHHEVTIGKGRADSVYDYVFIECWGTLRPLWLFISIPGASASARRQDYLVAQPGTLTPASHPMALPAASRFALTTPPIDTLSPLVPDTTRLYALPLPRSPHEPSQLDTLVL